MYRYALVFFALMVGVMANATPPLDVVAQLHSGETLETALDTLNKAGYRIAYSSTVVLPSMVVKSRPTAPDIKGVLSELLTPWNLQAIHAGNGDWLISRRSRDAPPSTSQVEPAATLEEVNVTGSRYTIADHTISGVLLDQQDVARTPHLLDDAVRILKGFPGVTGGDLSAQLNIRGGRRDEVELLVDGAEIHNGFHFNELGGILSVVDTNLTRSIDLTTGGMTADRDNYMSGIVDITTLKPGIDDEYHYAAGISFIGAFARASSTFADGKGTWLISARRGYMDLLVSLATSDKNSFTPRFQDAFTAVTYQLSDRTSLSAHWLLGSDSLVHTNSSADNLQSADNNAESNHFWVNVDNDWSDTLSSRTTLETAKIVTHRLVRDDKQYDINAFVRENNRFRYSTLRQSWSWMPSRSDLIKLGVNGGWDSADYDYDRQSTVLNPLVTSIPVDTSFAAAPSAKGSKLGAFASYKKRFVDKLFVELGERWDRVQYPNHLVSSYFSPRVNAVYQFNENSSVRAAWGIVYQPQGIDQLQVEDGVTHYYSPEHVTNSVLGFTQRLNSLLSLRLDLYNKEYAALHPYFDNLGNSLVPVPEAHIDRTQVNARRARSNGVEVVLRSDAVDHWSGWISYAYANVREYEEGTSFRRSWDQPNTLQTSINWTGTNWTFGLTGVYHSGAPITSLEVNPQSGSIVTVGTRNDSNLASFSRIDVRISRDVRLRHGNLSYYFEIINLLDHSNECCEDIDIFRDKDGNYYAKKTSDTGLPLLPSIGFKLEL